MSPIAKGRFSPVIVPSWYLLCSTGLKKKYLDAKLTHYGFLPGKDTNHFLEGIDSWTENLVYRSGPCHSVLSDAT